MMPEQAQTACKDLVPTCEDIDSSEDRQPAPLSVLFDLITNKGVSQAEAGKILGITQQAVSDRCRRHGIIPRAELEGYTSNRGTVFNMIERKYAIDLVSADTKKASPRDLATVWGIAVDKRRAEEDKAGMIVKHITVSEMDAEIETLDALYEELSQGNGAESGKPEAGN